MKLYNVTDISGLFDVLDSLKADVTVKTADGASFDWRHEKETLRSMTTSLSVPHFREISIFPQDSDDVQDILNFMMECRRTPAHQRRAA